MSFWTMRTLSESVTDHKQYNDVPDVAVNDNFVEHLTC